MFRDDTIFHAEDLSAPRPKPKLEDHPLLAVRDCLLNTFAATLYIEGRSSTRNLRTRHSVVTGSHLLLNDDEVNYSISSSCIAVIMWVTTRDASGLNQCSSCAA